MSLARVLAGHIYTCRHTPHMHALAHQQQVYQLFSECEITVIAIVKGIFSGDYESQPDMDERML